MIFKEVKFVTVNDKNYLLCDEILSDDCIYSAGGVMHVGKFTDTYDLVIDWVKGIFATHENIGMFHNGIQDGEIHLIEPINETHITKLMENDGKCKVEIMNPFFLDKADTRLEQIKFQPIMIADLVVIYPS